MTHPVPESGVITENVTDSSGNLILNLPASIAAGETLLAFLTSEANTAGLFVPGGGWEVLYDIKINATGLDNPVCAYCMFKKATGSEGSTETISIPSGEIHAVCYRISGAADPTVTPPEYVFTQNGGATTCYIDPLIPSALKLDDYAWFAANHATRNTSVSNFPDATHQYQADGSCQIATSATTSTEYSRENGRFSQSSTFWQSGSARVVVYPATSYVHPSDDFPHLETIALSDDSNRTDYELELQLPVGIAAGKTILAKITQEYSPGSSSSGEGIIWPSGWEPLYTRVQVDQGFICSVARRDCDGGEGTSESVEVYNTGEISAITWLISQTQDLRIDWRIDEGSSNLDFLRWKSITPLGGADNFLIIASAHVDRDSHQGTTFDSDYSSFGRHDSSTGVVGTRFSHRAFTGSSESPGQMSLSSATNYLSAVFAIYSDTQTAPELRTTQLAAQYAFTPTNVKARVTQVQAQYLFKQSTLARVSQLQAQALVAMIPCVRKRCQVWKIVRRDLEEFLFTTHDEPVSFHGDTYQPCNSLQTSAAEAAVLNAVGGGDIQIRGLISDDSITERDMAFGLFDGATVEVWEVPWDDPTLASDSPKRLLKGVIGETRQGLSNYEAEVYTHSAKLAQNPLLDTYTPACRFRPGDGKCPVDVGAYTAAGRVTGIVEARVARDRRKNRQFYTTGPGGGSSSSSNIATVVTTWVYGLLTWTSGNNVGIQGEVKSFDSDRLLTLWDSMPFEVEIGDEFIVEPGCPKTMEAHTETYNLTAETFGGFPDIPGLDSIIRGPDR